MEKNKIITIGNNKGGVGKSTLSLLFSYLLQKDNKVLCIDMDQQSNLSSSLELTFKVNLDKDKNVYNALINNESDNVEKYIQSINDNLDILCGSSDMSHFAFDMQKKYKSDSMMYLLRYLLKDVKKYYDYIIIDTAPSTDIATQNAIVASDYVVIATQTVPLAYNSTYAYFKFLLDINSRYNENFELLGVVMYLVGTSKTDKIFLEKYNEEFEDDCYTNSIKASDRVKSWSVEGITENKAYDKQTLSMYKKVLDETLNRIEKYSN